MSDTPNIGFPLLAQAQAQKEVTVNESLVIMDALLGGVISQSTTAPPGSPAEGDAYIVPAGASGVWVGHVDDIAYYFGSVWNFLPPTVGNGHQVWVQDDAFFVQYNLGSPSGWQTSAVGTGDVSGPGSSTNNAIALFDGTTGEFLKDSAVTISTDGTLASDSDAKVSTEKAVKAYVDGKVAGLSWKQAVRAATTVAGTLATSFENGDTIDGVALATGNRILIKNQAAPAENGIYIVAASGAPTRATDADTGAELVNATVYVSEGTTLADTQWTCTTNAPITINSTSLAFAQLTSGGGANAFGKIVVSGQSDVDADSSSDTLTLVAGSNITLTTNAGSDSVTITASGSGSSKYRKVFRPRDNEPPASNYATLDLRNNHPVLDFDTTTQETAIFSDMISAAYAGGDITVAVTAALTSATSGTLGWDVTFERDGTAQDIDSDSWATAQTITAATVPGTSGFLITLSVSITAGSTGTDSLAAGEAYRLRIRRDVTNDTAAGDAELWAVVVSEN